MADCSVVLGVVVTRKGFKRKRKGLNCFLIVLAQQVGFAFIKQLSAFSRKVLLLQIHDSVSCSGTSGSQFQIVGATSKVIYSSDWKSSG